MREMKDSGIEWIGEIPKHWEITKIGMLYNLRITKVSDTDYLPLSVTKMGVLPQLETVAKTNAHDDRKLVKKGDFVINSRSDRRGSCGISNYNGSVSLINTVLEPKNNMNLGYYSWLFKTVQFADEFYKNGHGIVDDLWTTGWQDMKRIVLPVPQHSEQQQITDFLDTKCSEIDATAEDIQKEISLLEDYKKSVITEAVTKGLNPDAEMKDSGIEWIGEIPKDWNFCKVKNSTSFVGSGTTPTSSNQDFYDGDINWIQSGDLYKTVVVDTVEKKLTEKALKSFSALHIYQAPFIIMAMYGASVGNTAFSKIDACCNQACCCIKNNEFFDLKFMYYWLDFAKIDFLGRAIGGTQPNISQDKIKNQYIVKPSLEEQQQIAKFLDTKCSEIDTLIADKKRQLDILADYKKSLIYEYVTGKKEVPVNE